MRVQGVGISRRSQEDKKRQKELADAKKKIQREMQVATKYVKRGTIGARIGGSVSQRYGKPPVSVEESRELTSFICCARCR
jgi:hypothetical protein